MVKQHPEKEPATHLGVRLGQGRESRGTCPQDATELGPCADLRSVVLVAFIPASRKEPRAADPAAAARRQGCEVEASLGH